MILIVFDISNLYHGTHSFQCFTCPSSRKMPLIRSCTPESSTDNLDVHYFPHRTKVFSHHLPHSIARSEVGTEYLMSNILTRKAMNCSVQLGWVKDVGLGPPSPPSKSPSPLTNSLPDRQYRWRTARIAWLNTSVGITDHKADAAMDSYLGDKPGLLHPSLDFGMLALCNGDCSSPYTSISGISPLIKSLT